MPTVILFLLALAIAWWWTSRIRVSRKPTQMMATRIHFPEGGIHVADVERSLATLNNPEEVVIPFDQAILVIAYPLSTPASIAITASLPQGFTRAELVRAVCEEYANVYEAEDATATTKAIPPSERTTLKSRNRTDGVYGIYGHDREDLVLTAMRWQRDVGGLVTIELHVES